MRKKMRRLVRRPSPSMLVSMLALLVATAGTAGAAGLGKHYPYWTGVDIVNGSLTGVDIKNKSLTRVDFRGSVRGPRGPAGANGANGAQGAKGDKGDAGAAGAAGTALAYMHVNSDGSIDAPNSKNPAVVTHSVAGVYCLTNLPTGAPHNAVASVGGIGTGYEIVTALGTVSGTCGAGTQITVITYDINGAAVDNDFMININ